MIESNFDFKKYPVVIVDPYPTEQIESFAKKFNAKIIEKTPNNLEIKDCE